MIALLRRLHRMENNLNIYWCAIFCNNLEYSRKLWEIYQQDTMPLWK